MDKMKRKIIIGIILILLFSFGAGVIYLNNVFLPVKAKGRLADALSTYLNYSVEIEKLKFSPIRGVVIQNITVYDKVKDKENTLLTIKEASFHVLFLPLIKERKIIIPIIHVDSPYLNIRYRQDSTFNFSNVFLPKPKPKSEPKIKFSFFVYKINIFNGFGAFRDERFTPEFSKTIQDLDIVLGIRQLTKVAFLIDAKVSAAKGSVTALSLRGNYSFLSKEVNSKLSIDNLVITEFNPYLKFLPLSIAEGTISSGALEFKLKDDLVGLKGVISTKGLSLRKEKLALIGDINIEPDITYSLSKKTIDYKTNIKFIQAYLNGIQYLDKLSNVSGDIVLAKNKLWTENLKLQSLGSDFTLKGTVDNFGNPYVKLGFRSDRVNLEKILAILPNKPEGLNLTGTATADINIEGALARLPLDIRATLQVSDAKLESALLKEPLINIKGKVDFTQDSIDWLNLNFSYLKTEYTSSGKLVDFKTPEINFGLASKDLDLKSDIKMKDNAVRIIVFAGRYLNSKFDVEGLIDMQEKANPTVNLTINQINLNPPDVFVFLAPALAEKLNKIKLDGILDIKGTLNGKVKDYKNWDISLKAASDAFSVYNLKFSDISFSLDEKDSLVNLNHFIASAYAGTITLGFISDLKPNSPTYLLKLNSSGIDLAKLKLDTGLKDKDMAGLLNIYVDLSGNFNDPASLKGNGLLSVKEGKLWQLNLFKGLGELFLLPDYEKVMFKEALGEFSIVDKTVSTENLRLTSEQLNLDCKGKMGFDGTLDFTIYTEANKALIRDSADIRKFTSAILGNIGGALTIKVSGTVQKPKYKIVPVPADLIKNLKDFFLGK